MADPGTEANVGRRLSFGVTRSLLHPGVQQAVLVKGSENLLAE